MRRQDHAHRGERGQILIMFVARDLRDRRSDGARPRRWRGLRPAPGRAGRRRPRRYGRRNGLPEHARRCAPRSPPRPTPRPASIATANGYTHGVDNADVEILIAGNPRGANVRVNLTEQASQQLRVAPRDADLGRVRHRGRRDERQAERRDRGDAAALQRRGVPRRDLRRDSRALHARGLPAARQRQRGRAPGRHPVQLDDLLPRRAATRATPTPTGSATSSTAAATRRRSTSTTTSGR